jgi:hypothetical protein
MSQEERYGARDLTYSAWHRRLSTRRFVGIEKAQLLAMIDLDMSLWVEYDDRTKEPLALIETAKDVGQRFKSSTVTTNLAKRTQPPLPAYVLLYTPSKECRNPADRRWLDIASFRVKRLWPNPEPLWRVMTPDDWARFLVTLRDDGAAYVDMLIDHRGQTGLF